MNIQEKDILNAIYRTSKINQRTIAELSGYSLGMVNKTIKALVNNGYLSSNLDITKKTIDMIKKEMPQNAIILAAGYGMRMVPINTEVPKGLIEVKGEALIERIIRQLHEVGINKIYVIVGFMKERYEYLIDDYGVELIVNSEYKTKNNLHSLAKAVKYIGNSYIIPCDIWCKKNPFSRNELYSWYMVTDTYDDDSTVHVNRKLELVTVPGLSDGNKMIGISYLDNEDSRLVRGRIEELCKNAIYDDRFWEEALYNDGKMAVAAKIVNSSDVIEINTYEQLRELDSESDHLKSDAIDIICNALEANANDITEINVLKKGMTNRSFLFSCNGKKYIMRIPGEGTEQLINRKQEAQVYNVISDKHLCDDIKYINSDNGYKITEFLEGARVCDSDDIDDLKKCMKCLRTFHEMNLKVDHDFDIFGQLEFYESLWHGVKSVYKDYELTKTNVLSLRSYIEKHISRKCLTHIDAVPDNFLFTIDNNGNEDIRLIDWEYAGMQDPHVDIAMFCIYSLYDRSQVDRLIDIYFEYNCPDDIRIKIYCYIAVCGLLWSNWCEYKRNLGVDFGEYSLRQYRYAKEYYKIVQNELNI